MRPVMNDVNWSKAVKTFDSSLEQLVEMSVLEHQFGANDTYSFAHDQIQAASIKLIPADAEGTFPAAIGKRL